MLSPAFPITGIHSVRLIGYDDTVRRFKFLNSWGAEWGDRNKGTFSYEYFNSYLLVEAWKIHAFQSPPAERLPGVNVFAWGLPELIGGVLHGVDVYDGTADDRWGWAFAVHRDGFLDIEEFFVHPAHRRQKVGAHLARELVRLGITLRLPLRLWVPNGDDTASNMVGVEKIVARLGLRLMPSPFLWATHKAVRL